MADPRRLYAPARLAVDEVMLSTGARLLSELGELQVRVLKGLATDSRAIRRGCLFLALQGETQDGARFVPAALEAGAAAVIISETAARDLQRVDVALAVPDTLVALGAIAHDHRTGHGARLVGLTGSTGKTTTKELIASVLRAAVGEEATLSTQGNFNNLIGLPLTLLHLHSRHLFGVVEMGMSVPGEMAKLAQIADPDVGLVLNASVAHLKGLGSVAAVARAKAELYRSLRPGATACVPSYDDRLLGEARAVPQGVHVMTFGERTDDAVRLLSAEGLGFDGLALVISVEGTLLEVKLPLLGTHLAYNTVAAAAASHALGIDVRTMGRGLAACQPLPGRLFPVRNVGGLDILDDTYNANPASTLAALEVLVSVAGDRRSIAVLGDMLELGEASTAAHQSLGAAAAAGGVSALVLLGPEMKSAAETGRAAGIDVFWSETYEAARDHLLTIARAGDVVLVKGSRGMKTERFVAALRERA